MLENTLVQHHRKIRSFSCRSTKLSPALDKTWQNIWPKVGVEFTPGDGPLDVDLLFGRKADLVLEIGFGNGTSLAAMAMAAKEQNFIGIEVYKTGVANLLAKIQAENLTNIRVFCADAVAVLEALPDNCLSKIQIFFADPWPKTRHHKRRLIQDELVATLAKKLKAQGILHLATDWEPYACHMLSVISANHNFRNQAPEGGFSERPRFRPITKYESRGYKLGHPSFDLLFERI